MYFNKAKNILAVGAHADDIEIGCGGTVALHVKNNDNVYMLIMTEPYYEDYTGRVLRSKEEGKIEADNAAKVLGVKKLIDLGFKEKSVPYSVESVEAINKIVDKYEIEFVYTHWLHDTHQDHMRTAQSVISACRLVPSILMYEPSYPAGRSYLGFRNQYYLDVSSTFKQKMDALKEHKSQMKKFGENYLEMITSRARHRGYEIQCEYAECFEVLRLLG